MPVTEVFAERKERDVQQATLCFLIREEKEKTEILLAMKKRGFGEGMWNGAGGKIKEGEGVLLGATREIEEEIGVFVRTSDLQKVAVIHFYFPDNPKMKNWNQDVHVFVARSWMGEPKESEEMAPAWFGVSDIPYAKMWDDDKYWLPKALQGKKLECWFSFDENSRVLEFLVEEREVL